jgi:hypothetical protein
MPNTVSLGLPLLVAEQAQKHVTHNEALRALDALVQLSVKDRDLAAPPGSPAEGDRYIVAASPTGVWAGHAADIAVWQDGAWDFHDPQEGWRCWVDDENVFGSNMSGLTYEPSESALPGVLWAARNGPGTVFRLIWDGTIWTPDSTNDWGTGKALRHIRVEQLQDLDRSELRMYLRQARRRSPLRSRRRTSADDVITRIKRSSTKRPDFPRLF